MRETDVNNIKTGGKQFIDRKEWETSGDTRKFYFTGYEKIDQVSQRNGKPYVNYYIYLYMITKAGEVRTDEETLSVFPNQATTLKTSGLQLFQEVSITPKMGVKGMDWEFVAGKSFMPENLRPETEIDVDDVIASMEENPFD